MAFLGFHPCPKCNSRDNLAEYTNNFYCFGCGYGKPKRNLASFKPQETVRGYDGITLENKLDNDHLKWLLGYNLTQDEMQQFKSCHERIVKGESRKCNLLVLTHSDSYWQARNFDTGIKYLSSGMKPYIEYKKQGSDVLVFTEDIISAVKVSRVATAVPMLGAKVLKDWWIETKPYSRVIIWGDRDKARENVIEARRASEIIGKKVEVVISDKDPKDYSTESIIKYIII